MNIQTIKKDFEKQLDGGFDARHFETFVMRYLKNLNNNDTEVIKTLHYYDMTNRMVRIYIRTDKETHNIHFPMDDPVNMVHTTMEIAC